MLSIRDLKYFYGLYYVFGQAPYLPSTNRNKIQWKIVMYLPFMCLIGAVCWCTFALFTTGHHSTKKTSSAVLYGIKFLGFVPTLVVIYSNLFECFDVWAMNSRLLFMCDFLKIKLRIPFLWSKFKSELFRDIVICISVITFTHSSRLFVPGVYELSAEVAIFAMQIYKIVAILHALFYVKFFKFIMLSLNQGIKDKVFGPITLSQVILDSDCQRFDRFLPVYFRRTRFVYFKLYEAMQLYNARNGWNLIAIMLEVIVSLTNAIYGSFLYFVAFDDFDKFYITRNY